MKKRIVWNNTRNIITNLDVFAGDVFHHSREEIWCVFTSGDHLQRERETTGESNKWLTASSEDFTRWHFSIICKRRCNSFIFPLSLFSSFSFSFVVLLGRWLWSLRLWIFNTLRFCNHGGYIIWNLVLPPQDLTAYLQATLYLSWPLLHRPHYVVESVQRTSFGSVLPSEYIFENGLTCTFLLYDATSIPTGWSVKGKPHSHSPPRSASSPPASGSPCCCPASPSSHRVWEREREKKPENKHTVFHSTLIMCQNAPACSRSFFSLKSEIQLV